MPLQTNNESTSKEAVTRELNRLLSQSIGNEAEVERFVAANWKLLEQSPESTKRHEAPIL